MTGIGPETAVCSARGCRQPARWAVLWNNPAIHSPERRKVWAACDDHRDHLSDFLRLRGFLRGVTQLDQAPATRDGE